jgi:predicted ATPase
LNEPEASLHSDLLPALAQLIVDAARRTQIWVTTHSSLLADRIEELSGVKPVRLALIDGATEIDAGD